MIDINLLRVDIKNTATVLKTRGYELDIKAYQDLEENRKAIQVETETLQSQRNQFSKDIGVEKRKGNDVEGLMKEVNGIAKSLKELETRLTDIQVSLEKFLLDIPNLPHKTVPVGSSESENIVIRDWGVLKDFDFKVKDHVDVGLSHGLDFELGSKLSGARFVVMRGDMARLHRATGQMMLDIQTQEHGYEECYTPYLVNET